MDFVLTAVFAQAYDQLTDEDAFELDAIIMRLLVDHGAAWARAGRIEGSEDADVGGAWILRTPIGSTLFNICWDYLDTETVLLIAFAAAP